MKHLQKAITIVLVCLSYLVNAQFGIGVNGGFQQSIPLVMRDTFSGKPSLSGGVNFYFPPWRNHQLSAGISYRQIALSHKLEATGLSWYTVGLTFGNEWNYSKKSTTKLYLGYTTYYILDYGINTLTGSSGSGTTFKSLKREQTIVPAIELGFNFKPREHFKIRFSTIQPLIQTKLNNKPSIPGSLSFHLEYFLTNQDFNKFKIDTAISSEKLFSVRLKEGTLNVMFSGSDSSKLLISKAFEDHYKYSNYRLINSDSIATYVKLASMDSDSTKIFFAKMGSFIYDAQKPSTQGIIIYNYKMEHPMEGNSFFIRNLSSDTEFEDPLVVKKLIKTLNVRLFRFYNQNKN